MGFIQKILGGIFGLLGGIFKAIGGVFGLGKKGEFYMELDDADSPAASSTNMQSSPEPQKVEAAAKPAQATAEQPQTAPQKDAEAPAPRVLSQATSSANPVVSKPVVEKSQPKEPVATNFATEYLVNPRTNSAPRRRPGPSVSPFKEMVRDMGKRSPSMG